MSYMVLSRKYRPRTFDEIAGQTHITNTLKKAVASGRIAQAYIFSGTRGTGKTTMARILAKALNCVEGPTETPCNKCEVCAGVDSGDDVDVIEIDGASHNSVDDVRELRANANYTPARARYKVYYIDEVHMLSNAAFNALLKTLEEPPAHVKFIFATTEPHKIPLTIQSRCQRFDFRNLSAGLIVSRLADMCRQEKIRAEEGALSLVARFAQGSMRDAESMLDQVVSFSGDKVARADVEECLGIVPAEALSGILSALAAGNAAAALEGVDAVLAGGTAGRQFISELIDYLRDVLVAKACGADSPLLIRSAAEKEALARDAADWDQSALMYAMQLLAETYARMARSPQSRGLLDISVLKLAQADDFLRLRAFLADLRETDVRPAGRGEGSDSVPLDGGPAVRESAGKGGGGLKEAVVAAGAAGGQVVGTVLQKCRIGEAGDFLEIVLPGNLAIHKGMLEKNGMRETLEAAASRALGREVRIAVKVAVGDTLRQERESTPASHRRKRSWDKAMADPAVKRVIEVFDGEIADVE